MRSKKALVNTLCGLLYELVSVICGFIIPRLILSSFGSDYNGITSSITQFLACIVLFKTSVSGVTRAALYKPLSENNTEEISSIIRATEQFLRKVALIFAGSVIVFSAVYPVFVKDNFDWVFSASLVLILGISTFVQYYFGITYQILLEADQRHRVLYIVQIITTILNTLFAAALIGLGASIHVVKLGSAAAFAFNPILINLYVRKHYKLDKKALPNKSALAQKWDAFGHASAAFIHNNTDIVVLTIFSSIYDVSVYTVYNMVCSGLKSLIKTFTNSIGAAFGNMIARDETDLMQENMNIFEYVCTTMTTVLFTIAGIMMLSFVGIYTDSVTDTEYIRPVFSVLMVVGMAFFCYRIPYQSIVEAAGHYKQTRNGAMFEAAANIVISVAAVVRFGLVGVAIGTLFANVFRTFQYVFYLRKHILNRSILLFFKQMGTSLIIVFATVITCIPLGLMNADNYFSFALNTIFVGIICCVYAMAVSFVFYKHTLSAFLKMFFRSVRRKQK